jgi:hypothetical protein
VDWATVIPTGITGVLGLAGIGGTLLSTRITGRSDAENLRTSISAEDYRVKVAEKRRIYANCLAQLTDAALWLEVHGGSYGREQAASAIKGATNAVFEARLTASPEVSRSLDVAFDALLAALNQGITTEVAHAIDVLSMAMRADLYAPRELT